MKLIVARYPYDGTVTKTVSSVDKKKSVTIRAIRGQKASSPQRPLRILRPPRET
jgi:hypothetical protein